MDKDAAYLHTMEYYSAIKKSEILIFATIWMDLEVIMLSEVSQIKKDKYHVTWLIREIKNRTKLTDPEQNGDCQDSFLNYKNENIKPVRRTVMLYVIQISKYVYALKKT